MRLIHYSAKPLTEIKSVKQRDRMVDGGFKPRGLWVSVEGEYDWLWWSVAEDFGLDRLKCATQVILKPDAKILHVKTLKALDKITNEHGIDVLAELGHTTSWDGGLRKFKALNIDWPKIAESYQGIVIAPYQWKRRHDYKSFWYYPWDCASGCIWDASAIEELRAIEPPDIEKLKAAA